MAAPKEHIMFDKTELVCVVMEKNGARVMNVTYDQIMSIVIEPCEVKKLFKSIPSQHILIKLKRDPENPIEYIELNEKDYFDGYKEKLAEFAKKHKLSFSDTTGG